LLSNAQADHPQPITMENCSIYGFGMFSRSRWKLLGVLIVASALLGAVGWQQFAPRPMSPTTIMITPTVTTVTGSQTIVTPQRQTEWIRIGEVKPLNYYLTLLESNGTQPYVQLAKELRRLPDLTNATAVAKITFLALTATNQEVKEAFELMIKGGTPDPRDYTYPVPDYNTELQVLYWLAEQNEFKRDDTLALAIGIVNGFWVTIGDEQVSAAVKQDTIALLLFFRETNELQRSKGYSELEGYPLEAKLCLAWTGNITPNFSAFPVLWGHGEANIRVLGYLHNQTRLDLFGYHWNTVSINTLSSMRKEAISKGWHNGNCSSVLRNLEGFFYLDPPGNRHWIVGHSAEWGPLAYVTLGGRVVRDYIIGNMDGMYGFYLQHGKGIGTCNDQSAWTDAWAKSLGIATNVIWRGDYEGHAHHFHPIWFEPRSKTWQASYGQLHMAENRAGSIPLCLLIFRPPVNLVKYFNAGEKWLFGNSPNMFYWHSSRLTLQEIERVFSPGAFAHQMKQWLLYN
jgi:hypothetical protein